MSDIFDVVQSNQPSRIVQKHRNWRDKVNSVILNEHIMSAAFVGSLYVGAKCFEYLSGLQGLPSDFQEDFVHGASVLREYFPIAVVGFGILELYDVYDNIKFRSMK